MNLALDQHRVVLFQTCYGIPLKAKKRKITVIRQLGYRSEAAGIMGLQKANAIATSSIAADEKRGMTMGFFEDLSATVNRGLDDASRMADNAGAKFKLAEAKRRRREAMADYGESMFEAYSQEPTFAQGREELIAAVAKIDEEIAAIQAKIDENERRTAEKKTVLSCPTCGATLAEGVNFCSNCGTAIAYEPPAEPAQPVEPQQPAQPQQPAATVDFEVVDNPETQA